MTARADAERRTIVAFFGGLSVNLCLLHRFVNPQIDIRRHSFAGLKRQKQNVEAENKTKDFHRKFQGYF